MKIKFKIIGLFFLLLIMICVKTRVGNTQDDTLLLNIEALANIEGGGHYNCIYVGSVDCPISHVKVYAVD